MAILKCKMCGGDIEVSQDKTHGTCESCGSTMTLPKIDDEQLVSQFNRANHFRRQNDFDKALKLYEQIISEDDTQAEAHWGAVLCRFGIEYVEENGKRVPTCHRASYDSVLKDVDYLAAIKHTQDVVAKKIYEDEANYIANVQKEILSISNKETPYDVFICYKETDASGSRTKDSALAQDVYYQLTQEGFKVFFSRISLEDKLGVAYEPYIFSALNTAKVMVIIGTKPEYFNAVWVKNEWSRYLSLVKKDKSKLLIPCYSAMDAYDLPDELSMLQSQDMGKIGFMQDLIRGVKKVLTVQEPAAKAEQSAQTADGTTPGVGSLLNRIEVFLEDGEWASATEYCDKVLDLDVKCAQAYVYKLCVTLKCKTEQELASVTESYEGDKDYLKAIRFGSEDLQKRLQGYLAQVKKAQEVIQDAEKLKEQNLTNRKQETAAVRKESFEQFKKLSAEIQTDLHEHRQKLRDVQRDDPEIASWKKEVADIEVQLQELSKKFFKKKEIANLTEQRIILEAEIKARMDARTKDLNTQFQKSMTTEKYRTIEKWAAVHDVFEQYYINMASDGTVSHAIESDETDTWTDLVAVKVSGTDYVGLKNDGTVVATGPLGDKVSDWHDIVSIATIGELYDYVVGLASDGSVRAECSADEKFVEKFVFDASSWHDIVFIDNSRYHYEIVALRSDGTVMTADDLGNSPEEGPCWKDIVVVKGDPQYLIGLKLDGTVVTNSKEHQAALSTWTDIIAVDANSNYFVGLKSDGTVVATGTNTFGECEVSTWTDVMSVYATPKQTMAITATGERLYTEFTGRITHYSKWIIR